MEHKLIQGGEQYLPFARSRIKALRATGLKYASQSFEVDGVSIKVKIAGEHEYIRLEGGSTFLSVFPCVQYPDTDVVRDKLKSVTPLKLLSGSFAGLPDVPLNALGSEDRSQFGTSPFTSNHIRRNRGIILPASASSGEVLPYDLVIRSGVSLDTDVIYDLVAGDHSERLVFQSPYLGLTIFDEPWSDEGTSGYAHRNYATASSEPIHCTNSSSTPVFVTLDVTTTDQKYAEVSATFEIGDAETSRTGTRTTSGSSHATVRTLVATPDGPILRSVVTGALAYSWDAAVDSTDVGGNSTVDTLKKVVNDVECYPTHRRWHAIDRACVAPNGTVFVVRQTGLFEYHDKVSIVGVTTTPLEFTVTQTRGYSLSSVSPKGVVNNHAVTGGLGAYGYIDGIFTSADNSKVYVYYGLHNDAAEPFPALTRQNLNTISPSAYNEFLDVVSITQSDGVTTLTKTKTIALGQVTLRRLGTLKTDHFESKLHGAALEVNGYVWADRFCYDIDRDAFMPIPDYVEFVSGVASDEFDESRDQLTGSTQDRTSYIEVSPNGLRACYMHLRYGIVYVYVIREIEIDGVGSGDYEVIHRNSFDVPATGYPVGPGDDSPSYAVLSAKPPKGNR